MTAISEKQRSARYWLRRCQQSARIIEKDEGHGECRHLNTVEMAEYAQGLAAEVRELAKALKREGRRKGG